MHGHHRCNRVSEGDSGDDRRPGSRLCSGAQTEPAPTLDDVTEMFDHAKRSGSSDLDHRFCETVKKGHGRIEKRRCWAVSDPDHLGYVNDRNEWARLRSLAMVESERTENGKTSTQTRYYISSLSNDVRMLLSSVRTHWGIENSVHWCWTWLSVKTPAG